MAANHSKYGMDVAWLKLMLLFLLSFSGTFSIPTGPSQKPFQRCRSLDRNRTSSSLLYDLQKSQCLPCEYKHPVAMTSSDLRHSSQQRSTHMHVVILLTSQSTFEKCMVTASGLLSQGIRVTMLSAPHMPPESAIRPALSQHIPCGLQASSQSLLSFKIFYYNPHSIPCQTLGQEPAQSSGDIIHCSILNAAPLVQGMSEALSNIDHPSVLLIDAMSVASILLAELFLIPSIMIVEQTTGLRHILGDPLRHIPIWHPAYWYEIMVDRLISFDLTNAFMALNRVRKALGLKRLRTVPDMWTAPGGLLWSTETTAQPWQPTMRNLIVYSGPFLPPCVPCDGSLTHSRQVMELGKDDRAEVDTAEPFVIVSAAFRDDERGRRHIRKLLNGLALARMSLRNMSESSQMCSSSAAGSDMENGTDCWKGPGSFRIVLTGGRMQHMELPPYVHTVESTFLDVLATFQPTLAMVSLCDSGNSWTKTLGPPVLCLDLSWSPRDMAFHFISMLRTHEDCSSNVSEKDADVLQTIMNLLDDLSRVKARLGDSWTQGWEMGQDVLSLTAASRERRISTSPQRMNAETFIVRMLTTIAYSILALAFSYLIMKSSLQSFMVAYYTRRLSRRFARSWLSQTAASGLWSRLAQLDVAWSMWKAWVLDMSTQMAESGAALSPKSMNKTNKSRTVSIDSNGHGLNKKRSKYAKKRS